MDERKPKRRGYLFSWTLRRHMTLLIGVFYFQCSLILGSVISGLSGLRSVQ